MAWYNFNNKKDNKEARYIEPIQGWTNPVMGTINLSSFGNYKETKALKLAAVYRAVNLISDSVAILELVNYQYKDNWKYKQYNKIYELFNIAPNPFISAYTLKKLMVQNILLKGNAYILITRDKSNQPIQLDLLDSDFVKVISVGGDIKYEYEPTKKVYDKADIIHVLNYSANGLVGVSTLDFASLSLGTAYASEEYANGFFKGGGALAGILRPLAGVNINKDKAKAAKDGFIAALNTDLGGTANSIVVLDSGLEYQPISVNPQQAQLLESRRFNILAIAQYFGVPLSKLFDNAGTSYATAEANQIDFLNSTLLPLLEKIEIEIYRKIFMQVDYNTTELKFDVSNLLRLDQSTQATVFTQLFNIGGLTTNEIREKLNSNYPVVGGNRAFVQQNVQPIDNILNDIKGGGASSGSTKQ